jgi:gluconolactonase
MGLRSSPDECVLYINDSRRRLIAAFDVLPKRHAGAPQRARVRRPERAGARWAGDGMKVDTAAMFYCGGSGGIWIVDPKGKKLGRIVHGEPNTTNIAFGGDDWKTLYFTTRSTLGSVMLKIAGMPVPVKSA